ncbi:MAG: hypothetical protein Fur0019_13570 [Tibeticola sp.]
MVPSFGMWANGKTRTTKQRPCDRRRLPPVGPVHAGSGDVNGRDGGFGNDASEVVNESSAPEQAVPMAPIKAQSAAVAGTTASICNAERGLGGGMSGCAGFVHDFSGPAQPLDEAVELVERGKV